MLTPTTASLVAIFAWWASTGALLWLVRHADRSGGDAHWMVTVLSLPLAGAGAAAVWWTLPTPSAPLLGFLGALALWGWVELAFLTGAITGPLKEPCPGHQGWARFQRAWGTVMYHEFALLITLLALVLISTFAENQTAVSAFGILYVARIFAKLNLFFGVPRINTEFIPLRLAHLRSYFRQGPITIAFPMAITCLTAIMALCIRAWIVAPDDAAATQAALLTTLSMLALLEHWLMVIPLPDARLWRWMLPALSKDNGLES